MGTYHITLHKGRTAITAGTSKWITNLDDDGSLIKHGTCYLLGVAAARALGLKKAPALTPVGDIAGPVSPVSLAADSTVWAFEA